MTTFGGFSGNPNILAFLQSQEALFLSMVRSYSILLSRNKDNEIINVAANQAYPRIGLILSAAKNTDNTYLFAGGGDLSVLYENVLTLMTSFDSPFSEGITRVAAALTAATLIRALPLDGDIKNIHGSAAIEAGALSDLADIVKLYGQTKAVSLVVTTSAANSLYFSLSIDPTTLPAASFNVGDPDQVTTVSTHVSLLGSLVVDPSHVAVCRYYMTRQGDTPTALEDCVVLTGGMTVTQIVEKLAGAINNSTVDTDSNVLVAPNLEPKTLLSTSVVKDSLYPTDGADPTNTYLSKVLSVRLRSDTCSLRFAPRRLSHVISRELLIVSLHTISKVAISNSKLGITNSSYVGTWDPTANYVVGSVVTYQANDYYCKAPSSAGQSNPLVGTSRWSPLYGGTTALLSYLDDPSTLPYVSGLLYGTQPTYTFLSREGPHSVLIGVDKTTVTTTTTTTPPKDERYLLVPNTFYFRATDLVTGTMTVRVSSSDSAEVQPFTVTLTNASASQVALLFLNGLYSISQITDTLGVLVFSDAVEIVAFHTTSEEVQVVVDILSLPATLEVGTGTVHELKTPYLSAPRSVAVLATLHKNSSTSSSSADLLKQFSGSASTLPTHKKSERLQSVYDQIDFLKHITKTRRIWW